MAILTGRYGRVLWAKDGNGSPAAFEEIISLNGFKLSLKTDYEDVTCFGDTNKVYVPGMRDISGSVGGFWNSEERALFDATEATSPGMLELMPNSTDGGVSPLAAPSWSGLAYMDADIDCSVKGAPKVTGSFKAAGPWGMNG